MRVEWNKVLHEVITDYFPNIILTITDETVRSGVVGFGGDVFSWRCVHPMCRTSFALTHTLH